MVKALMIYHTEATDPQFLARQIQQRLQDLGAQVTSSQDKDFRDFEAIHNYDIIALGVPCLNCKKCHIPEECRAAKHLGKRMKKLSKMDLRGRKLVTFTSSPNAEKSRWVCEEIEVFMAPTGIKPIASIGYTGGPQESLDQKLRTSITEQMIR